MSYVSIKDVILNRDNCHILGLRIYLFSGAYGREFSRSTIENHATIQSRNTSVHHPFEEEDIEMEEKLKKLKELLAEVADLNHAAGLLGWDQQTYMPPGSAGSRGNQLATLERLSHIRFTSDEVGTLLDELQPYVDQLSPDSDEARLVKVTRRRYTK